MFEIFGPWPEIEGMVKLPNPQLQDSFRESITVVHRRSMSGGSRTNIRRSSSVTYNWSFDLFNDEAQKLSDFFFAHCGNKVLVRWNGIDYIGSIMTNPLDFNAGGRNRVQVTIEFTET